MEETAGTASRAGCAVDGRVGGLAKAAGRVTAHRWLALLAALGLLPAVPLKASEPGTRPAAARRVVSMNPSLTETLVAIGAAGRLVGVDEFSARSQPAVRALPRVGGLFNPSLEAVVALEPDLVAVVPSAQQRDFRRRLEELGVRVLELPNITLEEVLDSIEVLGLHVGRERAARKRVDAIRAAWREVERAVANRGRPRVVMVLQREPLYVVGQGSFIDAMLQAAGAENAAAGFDEPYPRVAIEWLIGAAPEVILDSTEGAGAAMEHWSRWPSIPAVRHGRARAIPTGVVTRPGPYLDRAVRLVAETIHGEALAGPR